METYYAQASAAWGSANWNDQADGQGNSGLPGSGDTANANGYDVDVWAVLLTAITLDTQNGGSFWSRKVYATESGFFTSIRWHSRPQGSGGIDVIPGANVTAYANNFVVVYIDEDLAGAIASSDSFMLRLPSASEVKKDVLYSVLFYEIKGAYDPPIGYTYGSEDAAKVTTDAEAPGTLDLSTYVLKSDVVGPEHVELDEPRWVGAVGEGYVGTLEAGGGYTYGSEDATKVTTDAEAPGTLDLSLYTLTSGMVWPAEENVSSVETAWGPTGVEYAGGLNILLYVAIADVTHPAQLAVRLP